MPAVQSTVSCYPCICLARISGKYPSWHILQTPSVCNVHTIYTHQHCIRDTVCSYSRRSERKCRRSFLGDSIALFRYRASYFAPGIGLFAPYSSTRPGANQPILKLVLVQNSQRGKELKKVPQESVLTVAFSSGRKGNSFAISVFRYEQSIQ